MKLGTLIRRRPNIGFWPLEIFTGIKGDWFGVVVGCEPPDGVATIKYHRLHVALSSHAGVVVSTWITAKEMKECIEVLSCGPATFFS